MKKLIALMLVVIFLSASVVGCGGDTKPSGGAKPSGGGATSGGTSGEKPK